MRCIECPSDGHPFFNQLKEDTYENNYACNCSSVCCGHFCCGCNELVCSDERLGLWICGRWLLLLGRRDNRLRTLTRLRPDTSIFKFESLQKYQ